MRVVIGHELRYEINHCEYQIDETQVQNTIKWPKKILKIYIDAIVQVAGDMTSLL